MADKQVFLGVRLANRPTSHRLISSVWRHPGNIEHARLLSKVEQVTETVTLPGLEGRPATAREMEWLVRRSMGIGLPAPSTLCPAEQSEWGTEDLHSFADSVEYAATPLGRTVQLTSRGLNNPVERHVAVMSVGRLEELEAPDPGREPWLAHTDRLPFPVEWSCQLDVLSGGEARRAIQRKLLVVRDMQRHYAEHDLDEPLALGRQATQARVVEDQMTRGMEVAAARIHGWFRLAVAGRTQEECLERARHVTTSFRSRRVGIEHPRGQYGLLREFIPGEPVSTAAYRRRLPALYVSAGVPTASSRLGDRRGPYIGYTVGSSRRAVMFDTHYATEVRETSGLVPVVGGLGAGQERAARAADLRGGSARHPVRGARPLRAARTADRAAGAARAQRASRPHRGGQRNAEPVRRGGLAGAQRLPDRRRLRRGRGAGCPGPQAARDGCHQDAAATLGERPAADLAGHLGRGPGHRR